MTSQNFMQLMVQGVMAVVAATIAAGVFTVRAQRRKIGSEAKSLDATAEVALSKETREWAAEVREWADGQIRQADERASRVEERAIRAERRAEAAEQRAHEAEDRAERAELKADRAEAHAVHLHSFIVSQGMDPPPFRFSDGRIRIQPRPLD
jgi:hypothetical protein